MNSEIKELQKWYLTHCNGEWERDYGISIGTLENPGWSLEIDLIKTDFEDRILQLHKTERSNNDWVHWRIENKKFVAYGGPLNLSEMIQIFLDFVKN